MFDLIGEKYVDLLKKVEKSPAYVKMLLIWFSGVVICIPLFESMNLNFSLPVFILAYAIVGLILWYAFNLWASFFWFVYNSVAKGKPTLAQTRTLSLVSYMPIWLIIILGKKIDFLTNIFNIKWDLNALLNMTAWFISIGLFMYTIYLLYKGSTEYCKADKFWFGILSIIFSPIILIIFYLWLSLTMFMGYSSMY